MMTRAVKFSRVVLGVALTLAFLYRFARDTALPVGGSHLLGSGPESPTQLRDKQRTHALVQIDPSFDSDEPIRFEDRACAALIEDERTGCQRIEHDGVSELAVEELHIRTNGQTPDAFALAFLNEHREALGFSKDETFVIAMSRETPTGRAVSVQTRLAGFQVAGHAAELSFDGDELNLLTAQTASVAEEMRTAAQTARIDESRARQIALEAGSEVRDAQRILVDRPPYALWRVTVSTSSRLDIDAQSGEIIDRTHLALN